MAHDHPSHTAVVRRLSRACGHLRKTIAMIEEGRPCLEVAQQLQAVYNAIGGAKRVYVQDHIEGCLAADDAASSELHRRYVELREISRYL
ncbi:MAG: metal-sensing transcriptional repressor [Ectothiorhodospiraceae bacterium]|nr:metal-sensing transcriptional repressor [Ectothiorhodospiraceae bacterium]